MADLTLDDFDFDLPEALIALRPARPRPASRLLVAQGSAITDAHVRDLPDFLRAGDLLVFNDTKVIPARLSGTRTRTSRHGSGVARVEVTLMRATPDGNWEAMAKPAKRLAEGDVVVFADGLEATVLTRDAARLSLGFNRTGRDFEQAIAQQGTMPLPPYIAGRRAADDADREDYQTVFARNPGAVAAPTASLHFDEGLLAALDASGVSRTFVTLHVGAGTFLPVTTDDISAHRMHAEWGQVSAATAAQIEATRATGGRVIAVGTTALRLIETAARSGRIAAFEGDTDIFIRPGYRFAVTDGLMTNFHLPRSTLMMLVSALMGHRTIMSVYDHAIAQNYRFFSYGDSSLLLPEG